MEYPEPVVYRSIGLSPESPVPMEDGPGVFNVPGRFADGSRLLVAYDRGGVIIAQAIVEEGGDIGQATLDLRTASYRIVSPPPPQAPPLEADTEPSTGTSGALTHLAVQMWPGATVRYARRESGRHYWLQRAMWAASPYVDLGDSEEEAETRLRELIAAADVEAIAREFAGLIRVIRPGEKFGNPTRRCTRGGRVQFVVPGRELREGILGHLGDGWTYTQHGGWWDRPA